MLPVLVFFGSLAAAWYLLITRPQREQTDRHASLVGQLAVGQHVMTVGGLFGRIVSLDATTVVLELAEGLQTRVSTHGIARIASPQEAPLPAAAVSSPQVSPSGAEHMHHQHPPHHQQQPQAMAQPQQPLAPAPAPQPMLPPNPWPVPSQEQVVAFNPATHVPAQTTVAPGYQPAPWTPNLPAMPAAQPGQPYQFTLGGLMPTQPQQSYAPAPLQQMAPAAPAVQPAPVQAPAAQQVAANDTAPPRRHSRAPEGMGRSADRNNTELQRMFDRARNEREELAVEYQRLTAPFVASEEHAQMVAAAPTQPVAAPGDPGTVQLFVGHPSTATAPTSVFPAPARPPQIDPVPRPGLVVPSIDSETSAAFQRRAPYAPTQSVAAAQ
jgi:preprotein translocase subunit YajC